MLPVVITLVLAVAWFALPLLASAGYGFVQARWVVQDSRRLYQIMAVVAVVWFLIAAVPVFAILRVPLTLKMVGGLLVGAAFGGSGIGSIACNFVNCLGNQDRGVPMEFEGTGERLKQLVCLRATSAPIAGMTFTFSQTKLPHIATRPIDVIHVRYLGRIHRGRLGLWWVEFDSR